MDRNLSFQQFLKFVAKIVKKTVFSYLFDDIFLKNHINRYFFASAAGFEGCSAFFAAGSVVGFVTGSAFLVVGSAVLSLGSTFFSG